MSLFLDQSGQSADGFSDLYTISRQDGNLGDAPVPNDNTVLRVTYDGAAPGPPTAARLHGIINNNFGAPIVIENIIVTALNGGIDPYSGFDITGNGIAYTDASGSPTVIRIVYDIGNCNGQGIFVFDTGGNQITLPRAPLLYHELSHAFRGATNTQQTNDEIPAETDENVMRSELGLCLRDVNNHGGGCGGGDDCGGSSNGGCFIVSATTGSPFSVEVNRLRQLRDRVTGVSSLAKQLIDEIYGDYYQFSPRIAAGLQQDALTRETVLQIVVRPLLAWYTLAGALALQPTDERAVSQAVQEVLNACPRSLSGSIAGLLETISSGESLPADAPPLLLEFAPKVQQAARLPHAAWAILDPLVRVWRSAVGELELIEEVSQWLTTAPLEVLWLPEEPERLDRELAVLASFFNFKAKARQQLGERLAATWPEAASAFKYHGFI